MVLWSLGGRRLRVLHVSRIGRMYLIFPYVLTSLRIPFLAAVFYVDSEGSCIEGDMFCVGSGSQFAYAILDSAEEIVPVEKTPISAEEVATPALGSPSSPQPHRSSVLSRLSLQDAINTAVKAVRHATYRDGFSGGYINVLVVNATGIHHVRRVDSRTIPI